jgi:hypothetical protein
MNQDIQSDYDALWDEHIELTDEKFSLQNELVTLRALTADHLEAMNMISNLATNCIDMPEAKEHRIWRRGLFEGIYRVQKNLARALEEPEK